MSDEDGGNEDEDDEDEDEDDEDEDEDRDEDSELTSEEGGPRRDGNTTTEARDYAGADFYGIGAVAPPALPLLMPPEHSFVPDLQSLAFINLEPSTDYPDQTFPAALVYVSAVDVANKVAEVCWFEKSWKSPRWPRSKKGHPTLHS